MNPVIVAIVVTYNRKKLLPECLNSLLCQTIPLDKIIIIDNSSTDGTNELLRQKDYLSNPKINYQCLSSNTGGAGGFSAGLHSALAGPGDWFWLMDDDVAPDENCLSNLLRFKNFSECLHPRKKFLNNEFYNWEHVIDLVTLGRTVVKDVSFSNKKEIVFTNVGCFEGMLISRRIVEKIGLPDSKYFICEDDTLYGIKASAHTNVSYVKDALMKKMIPISAPAAWKCYYIIRNRFYLRNDALSYFEIKTSKKDNFIFIVSQIIDALTFSLKGIKYLKPTWQGFFHGLKYKKSQ